MAEKHFLGGIHLLGLLFANEGIIMFEGESNEDDFGCIDHYIDEEGNWEEDSFLSEIEEILEENPPVFLALAALNEEAPLKYKAVEGLNKLREYFSFDVEGIVAEDGAVFLIAGERCIREKSVLRDEIDIKPGDLVFFMNNTALDNLVEEDAEFYSYFIEKLLERPQGFGTA